MALKPVASPGLGARLFAPGTAGGLALLRAAWPHAVGPELALRTEVTGVDKGTLRVRVPDARWRQTLFRMRHRILARLRQTAGPAAPDRLGFVEGPVSRAAPAAPELVTLVPPPPPAPPAVVGAAAAIEDPAERARFLESAARYLDRFPAR